MTGTKKGANFGEKWASPHGVRMTCVCVCAWGCVYVCVVMCVCTCLHVWWYVCPHKAFLKE